MPMGDSCWLLGVRLDAVTRREAVERCDARARRGQAGSVVTVNLDFLRLAEGNVEFRTALNGAALAVADGMPLIWASRLRGQRRLPQRVAGVDFVNDLCGLAARRGYGVFLLGAGPGIAPAAAAALRRQHPGLRVVGTHTPPIGSFSDEEDQRIIEAIRVVRPEILFVAFGAPRQELWIRRYLDDLGVPVCMGVGGSFDIIAGRLRRAPRWMRHTGLEWLFRLLQEPGRLWRRYLVGDLATCWRMFTVNTPTDT